MTRSPSRSLGFLLALLVALTTVPSAMAGAPAATPGATPAASPVTPGSMATPAASPVTPEPRAIDLDILFIGAHPDDESGALSSFGQWHELDGLTIGVVTITRGEGGGNAVGPEEGPALGLIREREERDAVGMAGIEHVYYLDKVDFYYTVSAALTEATWGYDDTLARVVRVVRATTPDVIITMNPAPTPGNHGHHQMAARFAVAAYEVAGDPAVYPEQIETEGLTAWSPSKLLLRGFTGESSTGPSCVTDFTPAEPTDVVYGVWGGTESAANGGETWAAVERRAQRQYASQGWAGFSDAPTDPEEIACDYFTLVDSRVPFTIGHHDLDGVLTPTTGGLPAGTRFEVESTQFDVVPGVPFEVRASGTAVDGGGSDLAITWELPEGWISDVVESTAANGTFEETVTITPAGDAAPGRQRIVATLDIDGATGQNLAIVNVVPPVEGHLDPLPQVAQFRDWVDEVGQPALDSLIKPVMSMGAGETKDIQVNVANNTAEERDASVTLVLAEGFSADNAMQTLTLAPNETVTLTFAVTNDDPALPTANEGGIDGDYLLNIRTAAAGVVTTEQAGLDLVPVVDVPAAGSASVASPAASPTASGPRVDGSIDPGEYTSAPLDLSRVWEGEEPESPRDASGTAWLTWDERGLYVAVEVIDDTLGTVLPQADAKRHWRTDSVEIAVDPLGTAENTSATFKVGVFPTTEEGDPAAYRDADAFQGPVSETAPGFEVASSMSEPYTGYVLETFIPYDALPAPIDPNAMAMNIFIYDSDSQDLTGQTRLGWSTYRGVQGDPYRWGHVRLVGYTLSDGGELEPPVMPLDAAHSVDSPQSILQAAGDGVPLGGNPAVSDGSRVTVAEGPDIADGILRATLGAGDASGRIHAFAMGPDGAIGDQVVEIAAGGTVEIAIEAGGVDPEQVTLAYAFQAEDGATQAMVVSAHP